MFLVVEDQLFEGEHTVRDANLHAFSYAELFGGPETPSIPFGILMRALLNFADLFVGVPAGPYHLSMAKQEVPTVGLWIEHLPSWYDEPKPASIHVVSRNVIDRGLHERAGSFEHCGDLEYRMMYADARVITGEQVMDAVEQLLR